MSRDKSASRELNQTRKVISEINKFNHSDIQRREGKIDNLLQALFNDDIFETTKLLLLIQLQEQVDVLINSTDEAEQVFGSLLNFYKFLHPNTIVKPQVLTTATVIAVQFDFKVTKGICFEQLVGILMDTVIKGSTGNSHPLLVSSCLSCLEIIEETHKGYFVEYLEKFIVTADTVRTFAASNFMQLIGCVLNNCSNDENVSQSSSQIMSKENIVRYQQFLMRQTNSLSSTALLKIYPQVILNYDKKKLSKSVLQTFFVYCCQSSDIMLTYLAFLLMNKSTLLLHLQEEASNATILLRKLLFTHQMSQLPQHETDLLRIIAFDTFKILLPNQQRDNNFPQYLYSFLPVIHERMNSLLQKVACLFETNEFNNREIPEHMQFSIMKCLFHAMNQCKQYHIKEIFKCLLLLFKNASANVKSAIAGMLQTKIEESLLLTGYTTNFASVVQSVDASIATKLLNAAMKHILQLEDVITENWFHLFKIFLQLSLEKDICPTTILSKLSTWCEQGRFVNLSYTNGCMLLTVLSSILINHDNMKYAYKIASILWDISENCKDLNLRERALFYYCVIGNISQAQYKDLFEPITYTMKQITGMSGGKFPYDRNNFMSPLTDTTSSIKNRDKILILKKKSYQLPNANVFNYQVGKDLLNEYLNFIDSSDCNNEVVLKLNLSFYKNADEISLEAFAINLKFYGNTARFKQIKDFTCPYLSNNISNDITYTEKDFFLTLSPICSIPSIISVRATFFENDQCSTCFMEDICVDFQDLFRPLPTGMTEDCHVELFQCLWEHIENTQRCLKNPHGESVLTVKNLSSACTLENVASYFEHYIVSHVDSVIQIGIYLPPATHLLMKVMDLNSNTIVSIATDNYDIIDLVDLFLNKLKKLNTISAD